MCDTNSKPEEIYKTIKRKSVTKGNEKLWVEINCENCYKTLYLMDSGNANITEVEGNTSSTDDKFCFNKKKRTRKRKEFMLRKKYPEPAMQLASHKHINSNSNAISTNENLFQFKKTLLKK